MVELSQEASLQYTDQKAYFEQAVEAKLARLAGTEHAKLTPQDEFQSYGTESENENDDSPDEYSTEEEELLKNIFKNLNISINKIHLRFIDRSSATEGANSSHNNPTLSTSKPTTKSKTSKNNSSSSSRGSMLSPELDRVCAVGLYISSLSLHSSDPSLPASSRPAEHTNHTGGSSAKSDPSNDDEMKDEQRRLLTICKTIQLKGLCLYYSSICQPKPPSQHAGTGLTERGGIGNFGKVNNRPVGLVRERRGEEQKKEIQRSEVEVLEQQRLRQQRQEQLILLSLGKVAKDAEYLIKPIDATATITLRPPPSEQVYYPPPSLSVCLYVSLFCLETYLLSTYVYVCMYGWHCRSRSRS